MKISIKQTIVFIISMLVFIFAVVGTVEGVIL